MKILLIQGGFGAGGAEKVMATLAAHRADIGDDVHVAAMTMPDAGSFFAYPPEVRLHVLDGPARNLPAALLQPRRTRAIRRLIGDLRPDMIVSFLTKVNCLTLLAATGTGVPVVVSERNNPAAQSGRFWNRLQTSLLPRAAGIAMQTGSAATDLPEAQRIRAHVIPNPCLPVAFTPAPPSGVFRFVAVGRLDPQKGFDLLIEAFAALPPDLPVQLQIFGEGHQRSQLQSLIETRGLTGRVELAGLAPTAADWLGAGDALVISSRFEGFSNVLAEATCSGLPVVAFDCPYGVSDMLRDGENGLLVRNGDVPALTQAMARLTRDPALKDRLSQAGWIMADRLDPSRIMMQWDTLIVEAASDARVARRSHPADSAPSS